MRPLSIASAWTMRKPASTVRILPFVTTVSTPLCANAAGTVSAAMMPRERTSVRMEAPIDCGYYSQRTSTSTTPPPAQTSWSGLRISDGTVHSVRFLIAGIVVLVTSCGSTASLPAAGPSAAARAPSPNNGILFIGNSLTTANDLPAMIETLARESGGPPVVTRTIAEGGFSLEDHWNRGVAQRVIAEGGWSVVVLQQGPSALPESQANLREYAQKFDSEIRRIGARPAMYMVWPESERESVFDDVAASYTRAAEAVNALLYPVGEAWRIAWRLD